MLPSACVVRDSDMVNLAQESDGVAKAGEWSRLGWFSHTVHFSNEIGAICGEVLVILVLRVD
jgi:hypothetical protein